MDRRRLDELLRGTLRGERAPDGDVSLAFIGDRMMRRINRDYRGVDRTTDVLSFSYVDEPHSGGILGEVYVSATVAARHAEEAGCTLPDEIARLSVHGVLHILGWDHDTAPARRRMVRRQERYVDRYFRGASS